MNLENRQGRDLAAKKCHTILLGTALVARHHSYSFGIVEAAQLDMPRAKRLC